MRDKLNWESHKVAEFLRTKRELWIPERVFGLPGALLGTRRWDRITLETVGGVERPGRDGGQPAGLTAGRHKACPLGSIRRSPDAGGR